ncbi:hypothetical protein IW261DRAFT_1485021 [Armillaria novae-zelandiae]|uniref:NACHT domain-containing protein n=1 Tax=Armillaria novae-zelandiae TaxID=153914 RepID=A0AA39UG63_9AGAR|nr:hypothetical protein IW261DRAFT_1485021 [Armillaria novae-zelandiae]
MEDLGRIERFKSLILIAGQHDNIALTLAIQKTLGNIEDKVNAIGENADVTRQLQMDEKAAKVAAWLTPVDYNAVQCDKLQQRVDETGQWFLESSQFLDWVDGSVACPLLWCVGGPGVGKTILASTMVDHLRMKFEVDEADKVLVFCIFCDYRATDQKTITIIRSLLKQLIQARRRLTAPIETFYDKWSGDGMRSPSLAEITSLFSAELKLYNHIYIILDGFDELNDDGCREGVLDALKALGHQIRVLVTSRPLYTMQSFTKAHKTEIRANDADLKKCVLAGLAGGNLPTLLSKDGSLHEKICLAVVKKADGMFLLASIHMNLLAQCTNRGQLDTELDKLPGTLQKAYEYLLARIDSLSNKDLAYRVFGWVAFAAEPLRVEALQQALAIESGTKKADPANITDEGIILSICAGLVVVGSDHARCFKFVHYSTQEYFVSQEDKLFPHIHVDFTRICLAHMSFNAFHDSNKQLILFSWYSIYYWDFHAHKCSGSSTAKDILAFLDDKPTQMEDIAQPFREQEVDFNDPTFFVDMVHAVKLLLAAPEVDFQHLHGLCLAAYVGNYILVHWLLTHASDINCEGQVPFVHEVPDTSLLPAQKDSSGCRGFHAPLCMPLIAAASNGHQRTVRQILRSSKLTSLNAMSSSGLTVLSSAVICNSIPVVTLLLTQRRINTSIQFKGQTPFMLAARYGFSEIIELFLERQEDDLDVPGENGRTALHVAVQESQQHSIDLLLKSGRVDVNRKDSEGRTALSIAASLGSVWSVKKLVHQRGIDILVRDHNGKSAYDIAVEGGQHEVVRLLTEYAAKGLGTG